MYGSTQLGQQLGVSFGSYLGRQIALGACRDDPDDDFERRPFRSPFSGSRIPSAVDLRPWMPKVEDQGQLGSCTSNALAGALEYLVRRETGRTVDLSRLFVYYNQRLWDDYVREDGGGAIAVGVRVLARLGVPTERTWPYERNLFAVQPPPVVYEEAERFQVHDWWSVPVDEEALRACLASGFPIVFGTRCTESFMRAPATGLVPMPGARESADARHGRHALLLVGYDDAKRVFVVRNSWGEDWGDRGYGYMPYSYVLNREWTRSCWAIRLTERLEFDPSQRSPVAGLHLPAAPPSSGAVSSAAGVGQVAGVGAQLAISMLTGSGLLGGLAGGLVSGITPGIAQRVRGRDTGAVVGADQSETILARMRGGGGKPVALSRMPWDDGLDERAIASAGVTPTARVPVNRAPEARRSEPPASLPAAKSRTSSAGPPPAAPVLAGGSLAVRSSATVAPARPPNEPSGAGPDTTPEALELDARVRAAWDANGGAAGPLGPLVPPTATMSEGASRGCAARFAGGGIFAWSGAEPIVLRASDRIYQEWLAHGAARSPFGWPCEGPIATPDGAARALACTRGAIFDHPRLGTHGVHGVLFAYWRSLGAFASGLGYPLDDQRVPDDPTAPCSLRFERGTLRWSPSTGPERA